MRSAGIVFDLPLEGDSPAEEAAVDQSRNERIREAVDRAEHLSEDRMISQDALHELEEELPVEDRYAFRMALVDADLRVRTGAQVIVRREPRHAAVNVVDRAEPVVRGVGDAAVNPTSLWTVDPAMPRDELNTSPHGTAELDFGKPRRSEGEKHEGGGFGNNLTDLTMLATLSVASAVVPLPSYPARSEPARWEESYQSENQFEGTDKLGVAELGQCPHCQGRMADGTCEECGERLPVPKSAAWQLRADRVKRKTLYGEIPVWIEYDVGDTKRGTGRDGKPWERTLQAAYGFVPGTEGADGEPVDVYLGANPSRRVFVVSQMIPGGGFDEEKVMLGFPNEQQAEAMYRAHLPNSGARHFGGIREMSVGEFEDEYLRGDRSNPYKPTLQLRQFHVTGQNKMVPNPNPEGHEDLVTEEYAEKWKAEHGQGGSEPTMPEELSPVFQKAKQDKAKLTVARTVKGLDGKKTGDFVRGLSDKLGISRPKAVQLMQQLEREGAITKKVVVPDEKDIDSKTKQPAKREVVKVDEAKLKSIPALAMEQALAGPEQATEEPASDETEQSPETSTEAPKKEPVGPAEPTQETSPVTEEPVAPAPVEKPKQAPPAPATGPVAVPLRSVDTSKAVSPVTQQDIRNQGKAKELEMQFWRLLGGPGFNPYKTSVRELHRLARRVIAESYSQPDHGPLGTDGEPDHPVEDSVVMHAALGTENSWPFSVAASVLLERVAKGDLVKVQGPTGWVGWVSKRRMREEPGKYVPVEKAPDPSEVGGGTVRPRKAEGLVARMTAARVKEEAFASPRRMVDEPPPGIPHETWQAHFDGNPWEGGKPTPERARLHEAIISKFFDEVPPVAPGEQKLAILTMGGPASGKTTMVNGVDRSNFVTVDPDEIKKSLPEYKQCTQRVLTWRGAAKCVHKESTFIGDELQERAMRAGKHIIVDGTGADAESFADNIRKLKRAGYKIKLYMPDLDLDTALGRMKEREEYEGRFVPEEIIMNAYEQVPQNFEPLARMSDEAFLFDARRTLPSIEGGQRPRLVWSLQGGVEKQHDRKFMEQFRQRAQQLGERRRQRELAASWQPVLGTI